MYILRRPQNFAKSSYYFWLALNRTKVNWIFRKNFWPSQNIWTLWTPCKWLPFFYLKNKAVWEYRLYMHFQIIMVVVYICHVWYLPMINPPLQNGELSKGQDISKEKKNNVFLISALLDCKKWSNQKKKGTLSYQLGLVQ